MLNHSYIGTEHVLLGLLREEQGTGVEALTALGVEFGPARSAIEQIIGRGATPPSGHIPFTPRAKKVLELSLRESLHLGHNYIGDEHILLGLIREGDGVACHVLAAMGVSDEAIRTKVGELISVEPASLERPLSGRGRSFRCKHPDNSLQISAGIGLRTVRCLRCGQLVGILPETTSEAG
jgi:ATP-dependent Clp protease ATP-binding subunit ClpC